MLSEEEYRAVLEEGNYKVRCRYLTFLDEPERIGLIIPPKAGNMS